MIVDFIGQPFREESNLYDFFDSTLRDEAFDSLRVVTAWAKRSGLRRVSGPLRDLRARGGRAEIMVGIDEGGATRQGLELALELFDAVWVFHDPTRRTFHPKIYVARGLERARILVGSNNLTAGGVYFNYEAALDVNLHLAGPADANLLQKVDEYVDRLMGETELCVRLDPDMLVVLSDSAALQIRDEDWSAVPREGEPENTDQAGSYPQDEGAVPFGRARSRRRADPSPPERRDAEERPTMDAEAVGGAQAPEHLGRPGPPPEVRGVVRRWTKQLSKSDAQRPSRGSNPTGNLRLTRAGHPIDWRTFFRNDLFGTATWAPDTDSQGNPIEIAKVRFEVAIGGDDYGSYELTVDHGPHREAGQANHVTVLHWGELAGILREEDHVGDFVVIERRSDGSFRLEIRPDAPPPVL